MASAADDTWHADNVPLKLACLGWRQGDLPLLVGRGAGAGAGAGAVVLHAALSFLLVKCGGKALPPELAGDVARSAARLVGEVKALGLGDEAAAAAEQGAPASARLLDALCDRALAASGHQFPSPAYPTTEAAAFCVGDDGRLVVEDEADDAAAAAAPPAMAASPAGHGLLRPSIDAAAWEAEVNQSSGWLEQAAARTAGVCACCARFPTVRSGIPLLILRFFFRSRPTSPAQTSLCMLSGARAWSSLQPLSASLVGRYRRWRRRLTS